MSLRTRLILLILALVVFVTVALSALQLQTLVDSLTDEAVVSATSVADSLGPFLIEHINAHKDDYPPAADLDETKRIWREIVTSDSHISGELQSKVASNRALIEINVADGSGNVLVSNIRRDTPAQLRRRESFLAWGGLPWYQRAYDLIWRRPDWEISPAPIGIVESPEPFFLIQVIPSSVLLRQQSLLPYLERLALVTGGAILLSVVLVFAATHRALGPLYRIEQTIDKIAQGSFGNSNPDGIDERRRAEVKEFQIVESKLNLLGQQFHEALESAQTTPQKLDVLVERMATQLDVAQRLAAISRLSSGVAHEIKNPLNAILLRLDLLRARLGDSEAEITQELEVLSKEVLRLDRVVKTFLDFSRPVEVHFEEMELCSVVREICELIRPQANLSKVEVECVAPSEPARMRGDPDLIKQAVLNLMTNALEAMPNGGKLKVSVEGSSDAKSGRWTLEVTDTGPGIPQELRQKVFQLYFTTKSKGSGIGLAMTYRAVQLHNGTISFSSEGGQGTTFRLEFPALVTHA